MHLQKSMFVFSNKLWILSRETCWFCGSRRCRRSLHSYRCVGNVDVVSDVIDFCDIITGNNDCCCCCCCTNGRSMLTVDASDTWFICCGRNRLITLLRDCNMFVFVLYCSVCNLRNGAAILFRPVQSPIHNRTDDVWEFVTSLNEWIDCPLLIDCVLVTTDTICICVLLDFVVGSDDDWLLFAAINVVRLRSPHTHTTKPILCERKRGKERMSARARTKINYYLIAKYSTVNDDNRYVFRFVCRCAYSVVQICLFLVPSSLSVSNLFGVFLFVFF